MTAAGTYAQFLADCRRRQLAYIRAEGKRMAKADKLRRRYEMAMGLLGLHPLTRMEIADRQSELHRMESRLDIDMADSPAMRAIYDVRAATS